MTTDRVKAWEELKHCLTNTPILYWPKWDMPFRLYIDACFDGLGAVLQQVHIVDDVPKDIVICYISRTLKKGELGYGATQLECLCLVWALEKLHYYLDGSVFEVYTDCTAVRSLLNMKTTNRHMLRW